MFMPSFFCLLVAEFAILQVSQTTRNGQLGFKSGESHLRDLITGHVIGHLTSQIQLSAEMKGLLRGVRKGRSEFARDREKTASQRRSFSKQDN